MVERGDEVTYWPLRFMSPEDEDHTLYLSRGGSCINESPRQLFRRLGLTAIVNQIRAKKLT